MKLSRPYDATLKLRTSSIVYVHTHRFFSEIVTFFNQFHQHQCVMSRVREAEAGEEIKDMASRSIRVKLDIEAGSPILLLPMSSYSTKILVVDLGLLEVNNSFLFSGDPGTISSETLSEANVGDLISAGKSRLGSRSSVRSR